jgi:hypothetical protein
MSSAQRDDHADARLGLPQPGLQGGQHHLLVVHDGQADARLTRPDGWLVPPDGHG